MRFNELRLMPMLSFLIAVAITLPAVSAEKLKLHGIFSSNMVLQRDKPIMVWGWAPAGEQVMVTASFSGQPVKTVAGSDTGRWEARFDAQPANTEPQSI